MITEYTTSIYSKGQINEIIWEIPYKDLNPGAPFTNMA